jgi:hypothetical protein
MMTETEKRYEKASDLTPDEKMLVQLRDDLYEGRWIKFLDDLKKREQARPYMDKLVKRIKADIKRIDALQSYEFNNHVNLADLLKEE